MAKTTKPKDTLQMIFIWSVATAFLAQVGQTVYYLKLRPENAETGLWFWFFGVGLLLALWFILLLSRTKPDMSTKTLFEVSVMTVATILLSTAVGWFITTFIPTDYLASDASSYMLMSYVLYQGLPLILVAPIVFIVVRRLRATKQW